MSDPPLFVLPADVDPYRELVDHPAVVSETEAALGRAMYLSIRDTDDHSNGVEGVDAFRAAAQSSPSSGRGLALARAETLRTHLLAAGVPEVSIEIVEGRPATGDTWNACLPVGVLSHHIASEPTVENPTPGLWLVTNGRSDLPGPLCNGTAGVDLVYRIKCLGYGNHPGEGGPLTLTGPMGTYVVPGDVGRPYLWGTEYEGGYTNTVWDKVYTNRRTGISMTFREFMGRANAGLVRGIWAINTRGKTPAPGDDLSGYHGEHKTWAPGRKPDRKDYTTESGRDEIRKYNTIVEDEVSAQDVWDHRIAVYGGEPDAKKPARVVLAQTHNRAEKALQQANANRQAIAAIAETLSGDAKARVLAALEAQPEEPQDEEEPQS